MSLSPAERERLGAMARVMIPGGAGQPAAEALGLEGAPVDAVLRIDPSRRDALRGFLALDGPAERLADVEALARRDPDGFAALSVVLANAYFMHSETRDAIGYPGQEARDSSVGLGAEDMALVDVVAQRGPVFREA
jgi:hypothetical protein